MTAEATIRLPTVIDQLAARLSPALSQDAISKCVSALEGSGCSTVEQLAALTAADLERLDVEKTTARVVVEEISTMTRGRNSTTADNERQPPSRSALWRRLLSTGTPEVSPTAGAQTTARLFRKSSLDVEKVALPVISRMDQSNRGRYTSGTWSDPESDSDNAVQPLSEAIMNTVRGTGASPHPAQSSGSADHSPQTPVRWVEMSGLAATLDDFLAQMKRTLEQLHFPAGFLRFFINSSPLPFARVSTRSGCFGVLLRVPDLQCDNSQVTTQAITNRLVILVNKNTHTLLTYHACDPDPLASLSLEFRGANSTRRSFSEVERLLDLVMRRALQTYDAGLAALQEELDALQTSDEGEIKKVQQLTSIRRKTQVYQRCSTACVDALGELGDVSESLDASVDGVKDLLRSASAAAGSVQSAAKDEIELTMALSEFRSNMNLKAFTYLTILVTPITVMSSWYGMNWPSMWEFEVEYGYYVFIPIVWGASMLMFLLFLLLQWWREQSWTSRADDARSKNFVNKDASVNPEVSFTVRLHEDGGVGSFLMDDGKTGDDGMEGSARSVVETWKAASRGGEDELGHKILRHFFERCPDMKAKFSKLTLQSRLVVSMFDTVIKELHNPARLVSLLEETGERHLIQHRVTAEHFVSMADAVLAAVRESVPREEWTMSDAERAWRSVLSNICEQMKSSASSARRHPLTGAVKRNPLQRSATTVF